MENHKTKPSHRTILGYRIDPEWAVDARPRLCAQRCAAKVLRLVSEDRAELLEKLA